MLNFRTYNISDGESDDEQVPQNDSRMMANFFLENFFGELNPNRNSQESAANSSHGNHTRSSSEPFEVSSENDTTSSRNDPSQRQPGHPTRVVQLRFPNEHQHTLEGYQINC